METITLYGIKVKQPIGEFYIAKIDGKTLYECSKVEVRNMKDDCDKRIGIQRELSKTRVKIIKQYVQLTDACFPNSIILSVDAEQILDVTERADFPGGYIIELEKNAQTFKIIDGQHRIAGLQDFEGTFEVNISLFLAMDVEQQAIMFGTINSNQSPVNKSLMFDLSVLQNKRNPVKSAHSIGRVLNGDKECALHNKITPFAVGKPATSTKIALANFVNKLSLYISGTKIQIEKDRDDLKNGVELCYADEESRKKLIFRNLFIDENNEKIIGRIIKNYFNAVKRVWGVAWEQEEYVLSRTVGFNALFLFLRDAVEKVGKYDEEISEDEFISVLNDLNISSSKWHIQQEDFSLNGSGQSKILNMLRGNN